MSSIALHFAGGQAFFSGSACVLAGLVAVAGSRRRWLRSVGRWLLIIGAILVIASATPLPAWMYAILGATLAVWSVATARITRDDKRPATASGRMTAKSTEVSTAWWAVFAFAVAAVCTAVVWELLHQIPPTPPAGRHARLVVIGDSLSAGDFALRERPWPLLLAEDHGVEVANLARNGATVGSALKMLQASGGIDARHSRVARDALAGDQTTLVLLEIGGNDILGGVSAEKFDTELDALLDALQSPSRSLVMLELPLPPFYNRYGGIQRRLARRYGVTLIPKRYFAGILRGGQATLDGLHLSPTGHHRMAEMVWKLLGPALEPAGT